MMRPPVCTLCAEGSVWFPGDCLFAERLSPPEEKCAPYLGWRRAVPGALGRPMNLLAVLEVRTEQLPGCSGSPCLSKGRLLSLFGGLSIMALVLGSYMLPWAKQGLLPTPFHYRASPGNQTSMGNGSASNATWHCQPCAMDTSYANAYHSIQFITKAATSGWEFAERKIPDLADLKAHEPQMFSAIPDRFLPSSENSCWYEEYRGNSSTDPYSGNAYAHYTTRFRSLFLYLRKVFWQHLHWRGGRRFRLRCLPHFYIIGQPKCGTTDLYDRLRLHPAVRFSPLKEPHWWTRKRFGIIRLRDGFHSPYPLEDYLDLFDLAAYQLQGPGHKGTGAEEKRKERITIGEASASTMWDNNAWTFFYGNTSSGEPPFLVQDFIHAFQPSAKFIIMLRDPAERLYSDYLYFAITNKSAEDFQEKVMESVQLFEDCMQHYSLRACAYSNSLNNAMPVRLQVGLYVVFLLDWLSVFHKEQFLVLRLEDHASNVKYTMRLVFSFLNLGPVSERQDALITRSSASNMRRAEDRSLGPMSAITRQILRDFYCPFNQKLAAVLSNDAFLW